MHFFLNQQQVCEQSLFCGAWMSTSLLFHQFPQPETLNQQTPVLLCELAFYSRAFLTQSPEPPLLSLSHAHLLHLILSNLTLSCTPLSFSLVSPSSRPLLLSFSFLPSIVVFCLFFPSIVLCSFLQMQPFFPSKRFPPHFLHFCSLYWHPPSFFLSLRLCYSLYYSLFLLITCFFFFGWGCGGGGVSIRILWPKWHDCTNILRVPKPIVNGGIMGLHIVEGSVTVARKQIFCLRDSLKCKSIFFNFFFFVN